MLIRLSKILLALLLLSISLSSMSEELSPPKKSTWYSVEYIIFKINTSDGQQQEPWTKEPFSAPETAISFNTVKPSNRIKRLTPKQLQLHGAYNRLKRLASYAPIKHEGWLQELNEKDTIRPIHILKNMGNGALNGIITFRRGRFLHVDLDLQLNEQFENLSAQNSVSNTVESTPTMLYRLKQTRRIKTGDLHYFDHPKFGVMIKVAKIDTPVKKNMTSQLIESKSLKKAL